MKGKNRKEWCILRRKEILPFILPSEIMTNIHILNTDFIPYLGNLVGLGFGVNVTQGHKPLQLTHNAAGLRFKVLELVLSSMCVFIFQAFLCGCSSNHQLFIWIYFVDGSFRRFMVGQNYHLAVFIMIFFNIYFWNKPVLFSLNFFFLYCFVMNGLEMSYQQPLQLY